VLQPQELDEKAKSALGSKGGLPPTTVVDRLRKRLRMNGYRCHLTLQVTPSCRGAACACSPHSKTTQLRSARVIRVEAPCSLCTTLAAGPVAWMHSVRFGKIHF
jgi:hypothetical protein